MGNRQEGSKEIPIQFDEENEVVKPREEAAEATAQEDTDAESGAEPADEQADEEAVAAQAADPPAPDAEAEQAKRDPVAELQAQVESLTQDKAQLYDQLLRRQAEFENYRKRVERERAESFHRSRAEVLLELLPVIDNFDRALSSLDAGGDAESLRQGVELIHRQLSDALVKFGLEPVPAVGEAFDPHLHEAVTTEHSSEHEENTVIEEFQKGYKLGDKLLRPAKVKVASSPEK
jgi:molecular chaperone GrpE